MLIGPPKCIPLSPKMEGDEQFPEQVLVWRRYSDFELLAGYLNYMFPFCIIPPLPEKKVNFKLDKMQVSINLDLIFHSLPVGMCVRPRVDADRE